MPGSSRVALACHTAMGNTPFGVTSLCQRASKPTCARRWAGSCPAANRKGAGRAVLGLKMRRRCGAGQEGYQRPRSGNIAALTS